MAKKAETVTEGFDFDLMAEIAEAAPVAGGGFSYVNFGKIKGVNWKAKHWDNDGKAFVERDYVPGTPIDTKNGEFVQFDLEQDIMELNPALTFNKVWKFIAIRQSGTKKKDKTDWGEIIAPSATSAFGDLKKFFRALVVGDVYVAVEDFATGRTTVSKKDNKEYDVTAPKFVAVYKNKAECEKARAERYSGGEASEASSNGTIPEQYLGSVRVMLKTNPEEAVRQIIEGAPEAFGNYSADDLIKAANVQPPY